jgi:hypothetical protein
LTFLTWKWQDPNPNTISRRKFRSKHVNVLHAMIGRHYPRPFRFVCITDDAEGLDPRIETMPMPVRFDDLKSPHGERFPSCYCRLWVFSREATILGERILSLDIDVVILADLRPLVDRDEDFVGWGDKRFEKNKIAGGVYLLRTGSMPQVWEEFNPLTSPAAALSAGNRGSDQGWMSYRIKQPFGRWNGGELVKINWTRAHSRTTPQGARMVFTSGAKPPWSKEQKHRYPWIKEHWKL